VAHILNNTKKLKMKNYDKITPIEAIGLAQTIIAYLIKGFENIGFRKNTRKDIEALKELALLQEKRIQALENK